MDPYQLEKMKKLMEDRPGRSRGKKKCRRRDNNQETSGGRRKVRNPAWYESNCVVCWAGGIARRTARYCKECSLDPEWTFKIRIGGWADVCQPRLCSDECWEKFHTTRIHGLDFNQRRTRRRKSGPDMTRRGNRQRSAGPVNRATSCSTSH